MYLTLLHPERPKLDTVLAFLGAVELKTYEKWSVKVYGYISIFFGHVFKGRYFFFFTSVSLPGR